MHASRFRDFRGTQDQHLLLRWGEWLLFVVKEVLRCWALAWCFALGAAGSSSPEETLTGRFLLCSGTILTFLFAATVRCKTGGIRVL